jgi:hypothetical protein
VRARKDWPAVSGPCKLKSPGGYDQEAAARLLKYGPNLEIFDGELAAARLQKLQTEQFSNQ